ncbi:MAG: hypothetical protein ACRC5M_03000 [Anaeroplasmataceae bacterium]
MGNDQKIMSEGLMVVEIQARFKRLLTNMQQAKNHNNRIEKAIARQKSESEKEKLARHYCEEIDLMKNIATFDTIMDLLFSRKFYEQSRVGIIDAEARKHLSNEEVRIDIAQRLVEDFNYISSSPASDSHNNSILCYQTTFKDMLIEEIGTNIFNVKNVRELFSF